MFPKAFAVAFLALSLVAHAAPAADVDCNETVTVTARAVATKAASSTSTSSAAIASESGTNVASTSTGNLQTSLTLDSSLVQPGFEQNGQSDGEPEGAGQVASNTSTNNFINFCADFSSLPLTNGTQIKAGSCNAAPMGLIAATTAMPSAKFVNPKNLDTIAANTNFTIQMAISNLDTGFFVNPDTNYFAAPQTLNAQGLIVGHSHVVIEQLQSMTQTTTTDPTTFAFFKGLNAAAENGELSTTVAGGLPAGVYRMASINAAANHQPVLVAVAQHGSLDDMVYFTVSDDGTSTGTSSAASGASSSAATAKGNSSGNNGKNGDTGANAASSASASSAAASTSSSAAIKNNAGGNNGKNGDTGANAASGASASSAASGASASSAAASTSSSAATKNNAGGNDNNTGNDNGKNFGNKGKRYIRFGRA
ncbi:uncharacterized protein LAESUDRAFT_237697 [Laetiporus sulphureus 93-53]|uniref:Uncharacterized protein n=1 Tax=Laetiporus sulphureus 93-53 TaxID=1314785 RepID=A0A165DNR5_9APHY|nr:uncharacterized protein LAESUDRAFT_237697 [Laetiporus sulphureus 93-53]KZT05288.1 hypothetical protein LAESUDRAFT_237697 [Laetiporus sulphureus 93-53]